MAEITFLIEKAGEEGYIATAVGESIITEADTLSELKEMIKDAVKCHFENYENFQLRLIEIE